jgi:hypothetical protein
MHRLRKGQLAGVAKRDVLAQNRVINQLFGVAASQELTSASHEFLQHNPYKCVPEVEKDDSIRINRHPHLQPSSTLLVFEAAWYPLA